jgi:hypothetical protein
LPDNFLPQRSVIGMNLLEVFVEGWFGFGRVKTKDAE